MPAPAGVSITGTMVILELSDSVRELNQFFSNSVFFGEIVLRGSGATTYADGDIVLAKECTTFQDVNGVRYAACLEENILLLYTPV